MLSLTYLIVVSGARFLRGRPRCFGLMSLSMLELAVEPPSKPPVANLELNLPSLRLEADDTFTLKTHTMRLIRQRDI